MERGKLDQGVMDRTDGRAEKPARPGLSLAFAVFVLGMFGVASLGLLPLEDNLPDGVDVPRAVLLLNPAILVLVASFAGWFAAPRAGLHAPVLEEALVRGDWRLPLRAALMPALFVGVVGMVTLLAYGAITASYFASEGAEMAQPLATRMLYGGITEEVLLRWGMMSVLALLLLKVRLPRAAALWTANILAAVLFGLGHFPILFAVMPDPPLWLLALVLAANAGLGVLFGWLYMRRGLEAAIIAHALTHLFAVSVMAVLAAI
ncbi:CPBP family intramembrane glutamic endopeptidase [Paraurantiacibacter namhicola]|uniref:CAAX amino terminal protease self-immunity n=1 Tax=Paraurantiacibacter namhicola TaxID=645517 RepID=A0A1C7D648_9SPHN|nr:CPBP family intramembrane glutamic endopeptidase [Paraurantiacibacter namhicola]ANU06939.1 CAAX amino terminal protease self- immunity [Paraurantiacibacter namhicola]